MDFPVNYVKGYRGLDLTEVEAAQKLPKIQGKPEINERQATTQNATRKS